MDDSDEYFDDSFILDEAALASIQATEERFGGSLSQARRSQPAPLPQLSPSPPPSKRLKTSHGSIEHGVARLPPHSVLREENLELNPEIRVGSDGNYVVSTQSKALTQAARSGGGPSELAARPPERLNGSTVPGGGGVVSEVTVPPSTSHTAIVLGEVRPVTSRFHLDNNWHHLSSYSRSTLSQESPRHQAQTLSQERSLDRRTSASIYSADEYISSTASQRRARIIELALAETSAQSRVPAPPISRDIAQPDSADIHTELACLRAQLAASNAENAVIQKSLREALDAQLVKVGEVSILRKTIDKANKEHAEVIAKAKADMITHEKLKSELHAKLKEETERMATRLVFQQHEKETSTRKLAWGSVCSRRIAKGPLISTSTLAATPTRAQAPFPPSSTSHSVYQVSLGYSHEDQQGRGSAPLSSPTSGYRATQSDEDAKQPRFKGFHNAFIDAEPVMAQSPVSGKGNNKEYQRMDPFLAPMKPDGSQDSGNEKWKEKGRDADDDLQIRWEGDALGQEAGYKEAMMAIDQEEGTSFPMLLSGRSGEEDMIIEGVDWAEELRRIVFTHIAPQNDALTLHILISTVIPPEAPSEEKHAYTTACQVILETCGTRHGRTQYSENSECGVDDIIQTVANAFVIVGGILAHRGCVAPLTALLDLLLLLTLYIPAISSPFLGLPTANTVVNQPDLDSPSQLLCVLCDVVREYLAPPKPNLNVAENTNEKEDMRAALAMAVVRLMESLCWNVKGHLVDRLGVLPGQPRVFETLLDPAQAPELIARTLQLLLLLAYTVGDQASLFMRDPSLVEKLCYYLVEPAVEESYRIRHLAITLIRVLADSHIEARTILLDSATLVPSLVACIAKLSRLLWEDDLGIMNAPKLAKLIVDILYLSVNFLHHLVFVLDLSPALGPKLIEATRLPGPFNGVTHMFIVTFGRLAWAECPEWLDKDCRDRCEVISEHAMEIIETVVAGPECDSLWTVWHQFEVTDEEEFEAWKIPID